MDIALEDRDLTKVWELKPCFNPCFGGYCSGRGFPGPLPEGSTGVSILVLVDIALEDKRLADHIKD